MAANAPPPHPPPAKNSLEQVIRKCIPRELIPKNWKCDKAHFHDNIESLVDEADPDVEMFAPAIKYYEHIFKYIKFPKSKEYFDMDLYDQLDSPIQTYISMTEKKYIYKNDIYKIFNLHPDQAISDWAPRVIKKVLDDCWTVLRAESHHEMIPYPKEPKAPSVSTFAPFTNLVKPEQYDSFVEGWTYQAKQIINIIADVILKSIDNMLRKHPIGHNSEQLAKIITWIGCIMMEVRVFARRASIDLPPLNSVHFKSQHQAIIRVFSFDENQFVMAHELLKTMRKHGMDEGIIKKNIQYMPKLSTIPFETFKNVNNLEFVKVEIPQLLFAQTPIPTLYNGGYCILAVDALYELLMDMVVTKKVFRSMIEEDWKKMKKFFESLKSNFDINREDIHFLEMNRELQLGNIKQEWEHVYDQNFKDFSPNADIIKNSENTGLSSVDNLKMALESLALENCFGKVIFNYVGPVYSKFAATFNSSKFALHLAITQCQINCIVRKVPWILEFIHNQKACIRMNIVRCELCLKQIGKKSEADESVPAKRMK